MTPHLSLSDCSNDVCPFTGKPVSASALTLYKGKVVGFADKRHRDAFLAAVVALETAIQAQPVIRYNGEACGDPAGFSRAA